MAEKLSRIPHADYDAETAAPVDPTQPIGLRAAVEERQYSAERAAATDAASGADGSAPEVEVQGPSPAMTLQWRAAVELGLSLLDRWVERWSPEWKAPTGLSREAGVQAWCAWLATVAQAPTPLQQALAWTAMSYGPPLYTGWKARQAAPREADAPG